MMLMSQGNNKNNKLSKNKMTALTWRHGNEEIVVDLIKRYLLLKVDINNCAKPSLLRAGVKTKNIGLHFSI
jgi:hypothetical protein